MINDAFVQKIQELATSACAIRQMNVDREPPWVYFIVDQAKGTVQRMEAAPAPRRYVAYRLADVSALVRQFQAQSAMTFVWCGRGKVHVTLDEAGTRREAITMAAPPSKAFERLKALEAEREPMDQRAFLELLRVELAGCVEDDFVALVRDLRFAANSEGLGQIQAGKESLGKKVMQEVVSGGRTIPDFVVATVPVYEDLVDESGRVFSVEVKCALSIDLSQQTLMLVPLPEQLTAAQRGADEWIYKTLSPLGSDTVKVFCGSPQ